MEIITRQPGRWYDVHIRADDHLVIITVWRTKNRKWLGRIRVFGTDAWVSVTEDILGRYSSLSAENIAKLVMFLADMKKNRG